MSAVPKSLASLPPPGEQIYRLSVDHYHALIDSGHLSEDDPVELVQGLLLFKMPKNKEHAACVEYLNAVVGDVLPAGYSRRIQDPILLEDGEPEPDMVVFRGSGRTLVGRHPTPEEIELVIEVADSSLSRDRGIKAQSYAHANILRYWIVNLEARQIEVYTDPDADGSSYRSCVVVDEASSVDLVLDGQTATRLAVKDILP